jgi:hypothetical protein
MTTFLISSVFFLLGLSAAALLLVCLRCVAAHFFFPGILFEGAYRTAVLQKQQKYIKERADASAAFPSSSKRENNSCRKRYVLL